MNVSEQIINVLDNLCQKFGIAVDWSAENVLPYLKELCGRFIGYEICTSIAWIVLMLAICAIPWIVFAATYKGAKKEDWDPDCFIPFLNITSGIVGALLVVLTIAVIACQAFDIAEALYLPEKAIYDFVSYQISLHN